MSAPAALYSYQSQIQAAVADASGETEQAAAVLRWTVDTFGGADSTFSTSLGAEDQVITHLLAQMSDQISVFTLDTGRLFAETYELIEKVKTRYGISVAVYFPDAQDVESMVAERGINLFYDSVENRKLCCHVRKVKPLSRALSGRRAWITGLRRSQSVTRSDLDFIGWDESHSLYKIAPLASWSEESVWEFIRENKVPYHKLHDQGFRSIGCAACTRAVGPNEDVRAGRWWWENPDHKECGLHSDGEAATGARIGSGIIGKIAPGG